MTVIRIEQVLREVRGLEEAELRLWIESGWVRPLESEAAYGFAPIDVARVRLIWRMRHELDVDDEAIPLLLSLLDQVYGLRRRLRAFASAVEAQPEEVRDAICRLVEAECGPAPPRGDTGGGEEPGRGG